MKFRADAVRAPVANEIAGGLHPVAQVSQYGHVLRGRCFVTNGMRLIMPAVGNYSAGTNVLSSTFDPYLAQARCSSGSCPRVTFSRSLRRSSSRTRWRRNS